MIIVYHCFCAFIFMKNLMRPLDTKYACHHNAKSISYFDLEILRINLIYQENRIGRERISATHAVVSLEAKF